MPSLSERLQNVEQHNRANRGGCVTCQWWQDIKPETRDLINDWIDNGHSVKQLHDILTEPSEDGDEPQLNISISGFRFHLNHHAAKCRSGE